MIFVNEQIVTYESETKSNKHLMLRDKYDLLDFFINRRNLCL